jgi:hypothetical protein
MRTVALAAAAIAFLGSCQSRILTVQTEYLSHENLASFHVGTPDPRLANPPLGQKLIVSWKFRYYCPQVNYDLIVKIRFKDGELVERIIPVTCPKGTYVYALLNDDYFKRGGFKTYVASIGIDGEIMEEWRHQLWVNVIEIPRDEGYDDDEDQTEQEIYDEHFKGAGGIQKPVEEPIEINEAEYKYFF